VVNKYKYSIWGSVTNIQETVPNSFKYAGEFWDDATGLQYLRARWYDPSIGRFINKDTYEGDLTNPLSLNLYTYVGNNPLTRFDPSGNSWISDQWNSFVGQMKSVHSSWESGLSYWTFGFTDPFFTSAKVPVTSSEYWVAQGFVVFNTITLGFGTLEKKALSEVTTAVTSKTISIEVGKGIAHLDTNALVRALDVGEVQAIDDALAGRIPVISITAAKEYLKMGDINVLRDFLSERTGRIGSAASGQEIQELISQAAVLGRVLKVADAAVAGSAIKEGASLITNDKRLANFLTQAGFQVEGH